MIVLIRWVVDTCGDLLSAGEAGLAESFQSLSLPAGRLWVRLLGRKGPFFRADKLRYPEIPDIPTAAGELERHGFLAIDPEGPTDELLPLFTVGELREIGTSGPRSVRKPELMALLRRTRVYEVLRLDEFAVFTLLFFGNPSQDFKEFVLLDLGLYHYEGYLISPEYRRFATREDVERTVEVLEVRDVCRQALEEDDEETLLSLPARLPGPCDDPDVMRRRDGVLNSVAYYLERRGDDAAALALYQQALRPPARERRARILHRQGKLRDALEICDEILADPWDEGERDFATRFSGRIRRSQGTPEPRSIRRDIPEDRVTLDVRQGDAVEEAARLHYEARGSAAYYVENTLWQGLFGLAFWDIIFLPVPGVFYNRYQRGPSDVFLPDFGRRRADEIRERLDRLRTDREFPAAMLRTFDAKQGTANHFVNYKRLDRDLVEKALQSVPPEHLAAIFDRLSRDIRANRTGFPDLFVLTAEGYRLIEVKGPNDQVQHNQRRWLRYFLEQGIPCGVVRIDFS